MRANWAGPTSRGSKDRMIWVPLPSNQSRAHDLSYRASPLARVGGSALHFRMSVSYPSRLLIGGEWCGAARTAPVVNPFTGEEFARVPLGGAEEIERGIAAAKAAFPGVRSVAAHRRADLLLAVASGIARRKAEFIDLIVSEAGKPVTFA